VPSPNSGKIFFSGNYQVKFGNFVNFSYAYFRANVLPPNLKVDLAPTPMFMYGSVESTEFSVPPVSRGSV